MSTETIDPTRAGTAPPTAGWEVGQRAQYVARSSTWRGRFAISRGRVESVTAEHVAVRWDGGGLGRFTPDELDRLAVEDSPAAHRAVFGPTTPIAADVLARPTDAHGTTVANEVELDTWAWNDPDTERRMEDLVTLATDAGMWGRRVINLEVLPDYDEPAYALVSLGLLDGYRLVGHTVELRELIGPDRDSGDPRGDPRRLDGPALAERVLAGVSRAAADLASRAACLDLEIARTGHHRAAERATAATTGDAVTRDVVAEGVRGDG